MDFTLFGGFDKVTTPAFVNADGGLNDDDASMIGIAAFIEATEGYYEFGYGFVNGKMSADSTITVLPQHIPNDMVVGYLIVFAHSGHLVKARRWKRKNCRWINANRREFSNYVITIYIGSIL